MGIPFTIPMGFLLTVTIGFLFTMALGIQLTISNSPMGPTPLWEPGALGSGFRRSSSAWLI